MSGRHVDEFDAYIAEIAALLNEHGVELIEDLPAETYRQVLARGREAGYLVGDHSALAHISGEHDVYLEGCPVCELDRSLAERYIENRERRR